MNFKSFGLIILLVVSALVIAEEKMDLSSNKSLAFIEIQAQCYMKGQLNDEKKWLISETSEDYYTQKFTNENYHEACVDSFKISKYEVTLELYQQYASENENITIGVKGCYVVGDNGWENNPNADWKNPTFKQENTHPVVCISYYEAKNFIAWLNNKLKPNHEFRLPTEVEWELAARGSEKQRGSWRYWGNDIKASEACKYGNVSDLSLNEYMQQDYSFKCHDGAIQTTNVHSYEPNDYNLYNMLGNAQEFTCSGYSDTPLETENSCETQERMENITVKGASWYYPPIYNRAAFRGGLPRNLRFYGVGFRLAQDAE
ncbi:formylglycine-generating enzyme family protein [Thalassotalea ganghwensis]